MKFLMRYGSLYMMIIPVCAYFILFSYYPLIRGFVISLQEFRLIGNRPFVGLRNYVVVLQDPVFWKLMANTVIIGGGILIVGFVMSLIIAISLNEVAQKFLAKFTQTVIYFPHLFSWVVVSGIWINLLSPDGGFINELLKWFGWEKPIHFLAEENFARPIMVTVAVWKDVGYYCILFLAAIMGIHPVLYESAKIDGANRWQQIRYITLPQLIPTMKVVLLLQMMGFLRIFDQIYLMSNPAIAHKVNVVMTYIYEKGIQQFQMGVATAAGLLVLLATFLLTMLTRKLIRFDEE